MLDTVTCSSLSQQETKERSVGQPTRHCAWTCKMAGLRWVPTSSFGRAWARARPIKNSKSPSRRHEHDVGWHCMCCFRMICLLTGRADDRLPRSNDPGFVFVTSTNFDFCRSTQQQQTGSFDHCWVVGCPQRRISAAVSHRCGGVLCCSRAGLQQKLHDHATLLARLPQRQRWSSKHPLT
mmetsp:Transcript_29754/g.74949  ORF Transcript_29754/g.74949 Transcript_29754/m.74949 type:complete len:180 (+) Transcript_29754:536-1075(+)